MVAPVGRSLSSLGRRLEPLALFAPAACAVVLACAVPLLSLGVELLSGGAIAQLRATLADPRAWLLLLQSIALALAVTAGALALGVPLGVLLGRSDMAGRRPALWLHLFPLFLPPFLLALGWFHLFGRAGLFGSAATSALLFGGVGVVATLVLALSPVVTALTALGLDGIDPSLEEAAQVAGAPTRVVTRILLPLAWRSIALGAMIVFALALSEIGVPMFLGVRSYSAAVFTRLAGMRYAPGEAVALALPLVGVGLLLVAVDRWLLGRRSYAALGLRSRERPLLRLGRARLPVSVAGWFAVATSLLPLGALASRAGARGMSEATSWMGSSAITSVITSVAAASAIVLAGLLVGHALARGRRGSGALDALAVLAFMTPSAVLGAGVIAAWNRPATQRIYASVAILVIGLSARYAVVGIRVLAAVFARSSAHYEEAAACSGSGFARRILRIVVPMHARGIVGAWLIALVFCLRDLDAVAVFYPPGGEPLVVRIFTLEANGPQRAVAGLSVYHAALTALLLLGGGLLLRRSEGERAVSGQP